VGASLLLGLSACASVHEGIYATALGPDGQPSPGLTTPLRISGTEAAELSGPALGVVQVTLENPSKQWIRVRGVSLDFGGAIRNAAVTIPAGGDLVTWQRAVQQRNAITAENRANALAVLALVGGVASIASPSPEVSAMGDLVALGSLGMLAADDVKAGVLAAQRAALYPENHLLAPDVSVPPGLFVKKWVLLHTTNDKVTGPLTSLRMHFETDDGSAHTVRLDFRVSSCGSQWQHEFCRERSGQSAFEP
jgi:hypothetical protein